MGREAHNKRKDITCELVAKLYNEGNSSITIANELGVSKKLILRRLKDADVSRRQSNKFEEITKEILVELYINKRMSTREIGSIYGCSNHLVRKRLIKYNIPVRLNVDPTLSINERKEKYGKPGDSHNLWKGGVSRVSGLIRNRLAHVSKERLIIDNYTCQSCGNPSGTMHAHHIRRFSNIIKDILDENPQINLLNEDNRLKFVDICEVDARLTDIDNLTTLCEKCHHNQHNNEKFDIIPFELIEKKWRDYVDLNHFEKSVSEMFKETNVKPFRIIEYMKHKGLPFAFENKKWLSNKLTEMSCSYIAREFNSTRYRVFATDIRKQAYNFGLIDYENHAKDKKASS